MCGAPSCDHDSDFSSAAQNCDVATLVVATRHDIVSAGLAALLQAAGHRVVARCSREDDLLSSIEAHHPHITILADSVVTQIAAKTISRLRTYDRSMAIIFLLEEPHPTMIADLLDTGVEGILSSGAPARSLTDCVRSVSRGGRWVDPELVQHLVITERSRPIADCLTSREGDIADLISRGWSNKEIARVLDLSEGTVKAHLHHMYEKLHLKGRTQLALSMAAGGAPMLKSSLS
jgi:two-component system, NarL family, nitrate/nitrite response regulator NarL